MIDVGGWAPQTIYTVSIAAPAERVWEALTSPAFSRQSFSGFAVTAEPRAGGTPPMRMIAALKRRGIRIPGLPD